MQGNFFRITGPLWGKFTGDMWIPLDSTRNLGLQLQNPGQKQTQQNFSGKFPSGPTGIPFRLNCFKQ